MSESPLVSPVEKISQKPKKKIWQLTLIEWVVVAAIVVMLVALLLPPVTSSGRDGARQRCKSNLKEIALALHNYSDAHGTFPPAYLNDALGRPAHSWRVLVLPYFNKPELKALYDDYRFDEPWDGPHNRELAARADGIFRCLSENTPSNKDDSAARAQTSYLAVIGPETLWRGAQGVCHCDIYDGDATTLHVVEVANSGIHWMEPRDLHVGQMAPTINPKAGQGISSRHKAGAHGVLANGSVRFLLETLSAETIRGLLTIQGGETIPDDF